MPSRQVEIHNSLLTAEFSESSADALPHARYLAESLGAMLHVPQVIANPWPRLYGPAAKDYISIVNHARSRPPGIDDSG
jgi:hypothetical protein